MWPSAAAISVSAPGLRALGFRNFGFSISGRALQHSVRPRWNMQLRVHNNTTFALEHDGRHQYFQPTGGRLLLANLNLQRVALTTKVAALLPKAVRTRHDTILHLAVGALILIIR
eukprot:3315180-Pyramimonas_sp.AAC.1